MHRVLCFAVAGWLLAAAAVRAAPDPALSGLQVEPGPSPLDCLTVGADAPPVYPGYERARKREGLVRVRLRFDAADAPPAVEVMHEMGGQAFSDAVRQRLSAYRLPCLQPGVAPVVAIQEFQFIPGDGRPVYWTKARIEASDALKSVAGCLERGPLPDYPFGAQRAGLQGVVLVRLSFSSSDAPPQAEILYDGGHAMFAEVVETHVASYRLPCLTPDSAPLRAMQAFEFIMEGGGWYVLRPLTLQKLVGAIDDLSKHRVRFNFDTMGCPFDVKFVLHQPYAENPVAEIGSRDANRREFLAWLGTVSLKLPKRAHSRVIGDSTTISVPCGTLDLL